MAAATMACASGCSQARSTAAASRSTSASAQPPAGTIHGHAGAALGQGAGLVHDQGVDLLQPLQRPAFLISTPSLAPRPTPTMIAIGVASPRAHGQAMISTTTATKGMREPRLGPTAPRPRTWRPRHNDRRDEPGGDPVGQPLDRGPGALCLGDMATIRASIVSRPTARRASPAHRCR